VERYVSQNCRRNSTDEECVRWSCDRTESGSPVLEKTGIYHAGRLCPLWMMFLRGLLCLMLFDELLMRGMMCLGPPKN
jgi:hypothetical protein